MVNRIINYEATGAAGVEDGMVGVFSTRAVEVRSREWLCVEGCPKDSFAFAVCTLMDYSIIDFEVADVLGNTWPLVCTNKGEGVVAGVAGVVAHPLTPWMVSIPLLSLRGGMSHSHWVSGTTEEGRWGVVNQPFILSFHVWVDNIGKDGDVAEV